MLWCSVTVQQGQNFRLSDLKVILSLRAATRSPTTWILRPSQWNTSVVVSVGSLLSQGLWCLISIPEDAYSGICVWIIKAVFFLFVNGFGLTLQISTSFTQHYFSELLVYESATSKAERQKYVEKHLLSSTICLKSGRINMMMHKYQQLQQEEHKAAYICYHCTDSHYSILMITLVHGIYLFSLNIN